MSADVRSDFTAYSVGLVCASVCTSLPVEEAAQRLNEEHPTGISSRWTLDDDPTFADGVTPNGATCEHQAGRRHWLFSC